MQPEAELLPPPTAFLSTTAHSDPQPPPWFAQLVILLQAAQQDGLPDALAAIHVQTGRAGNFETLDVVLALLVHVVSGQPHIQDTFAELCQPTPAGQPSANLLPFALPLPALWGRKHLLSRSTLSRRLSALPQHAMEAVRDAVTTRLHRNGLRGELRGGFLDRSGRRRLLFHADGTAQTARRPTLLIAPDFPLPRRRRDDLMAKGRAGRKRACILRTRLVVQHGHTTEGLATFGNRGNTALAPHLLRAVDTVVHYLQAHEQPAANGVLCLDGLYGHAKHMVLVDRTGLGWLCRCVDYRLLKHPDIRAVLQQQVPVDFVQPTTGLTRRVFDAGVMPWTAAGNRDIGLSARILITLRAPGPKEQTGKPRIGVRLGDEIAELFATNLDGTALTGCDVVMMYLCRGAFESTLHDEDRLTDADRFVNGQPNGQEVFQILCQYIDNLRLQLAVRGQPVSVVRTRLADPVAVEVTEAEVTEAAAIEAEVTEVAVAEVAVIEVAVIEAEVIEAEVIEAEAIDAEPARRPAGAERDGEVLVPPSVPGRVGGSREHNHGRFSGADFVFDAQGQLRCPDGVVLRPFSSGRSDARAGVRYQAPVGACRRCAQAVLCVGPRSALRHHGRRVTVHPSGSSGVASAAQPPAEPCSAASPSAAAGACRRPPVYGTQSLDWEDVPSWRLRRQWCASLRSQAVKVERLEGAVERPSVSWQTRAERSHRRKSWSERLLRNTARSDVVWQVFVSGVRPGTLPDTICGPPPSR